MPLPHTPRPALGRRAVLLGGTGLGLTALTGLTGCTSPVIGGGPGRPSTGRTAAAPAPLAGANEAAAEEAALAAAAGRLLGRTGDDAPSDRQRRILGQIRDAHLAHEQALTAPDPTDPGSTGSATPTPSASPSSTPSSSSPSSGTAKLSTALADLAKSEDAAAADHRARVAGSSGAVALLWASMAAASHGYADALVSNASRSATVLGRARPALAELTGAEAMTQLLGEIDAVLYGYQAARVRLSGSQASSAASRVGAYFRLRDTVRAELVAASAQPTPAAPAYVLKPEPTDADTARTLAAALETRIQPFLGQWLRTATGSSDQKTAQSALEAAVSAGLSWGAPLNYWPGWGG